MQPIDQVAVTFDPHDHETRAQCAEVYGRLRESCPVFHSDEWGGFWVASRHEDVYEVGRDVERFSSNSGVMLPPIGHGRPLRPMESDPPEHAEYRRILLRAFAPAAVAGMEDDVRELAASLLAAVADQGRVDLYHALAKPLPMLVISRMLGIERDDVFWEWTDVLIYGRVDGTSEERVREVADALYGFLAEHVADRRAHPGDDLISLVVHGMVGDRPYTEDEVLDLCFFLLIAGLENTAFGIRAALRHLAVAPADRSALIADPSLVSNFVEQSLRLYSPVTALARIATRDTEVAGQRIQAGERVLLLFGSANRDGKVFDDPNEFHLERRDGRHLAFGIGPHRCLGSNLARLELRVAVEEALRWIPGYRLAGDDPGWYTASPLEVVW